MISFRYHLVTIVAVFLALALGLVAGTNVVDQGLVNRLKEQTQNANHTAEQLRTQNEELQGRVSRGDAFAAAAVPLVTADRLLGSKVVIVTDETTNGALSQVVRRVLDGAGADVTALLATTPRLAQPDDSSSKSLAQVLGLPPESPSQSLLAEAASQLASRLNGGPHGPQDLLLELLDQGFLAAGQGSALNGPGEVAGVGGPGQIVVVVSGGVAEPPLSPDEFLVPLTEGLVSAGTRTVAVEGAQSQYPFVSLLRDAAALDGKQLVTVDDAGEPSGQVALVLGAQELSDNGSGGDYGNKEGADGMLPPLEG